jgi:hypothetical protein
MSPSMKPSAIPLGDAVFLKAWSIELTGEKQDPRLGLRHCAEGLVTLGVLSDGSDRSRVSEEGLMPR